MQNPKEECLGALIVAKRIKECEQIVNDNIDTIKSKKVLMNAMMQFVGKKFCGIELHMGRVNELIKEIENDYNDSFVCICGPDKNKDLVDFYKIHNTLDYDNIINKYSEYNRMKNYVKKYELFRENGYNNLIKELKETIAHCESENIKINSNIQHLKEKLENLREKHIVNN